MTSDDAFLAAILEAPDDDAPRLVYADYLDEHGQPARAAFIRVQVTLATLPEGDERRRDLEAREQGLLEQHEEDWVGPLLRLLDAKASDLKFCRGVIEEASLEIRAVQTHAAELFRLVPLRHLRHHLPTRSDAPPLQAAGWDYRLIRFVDLQVAALTALQQVSRLVTLDLHGVPVGDGGARALVSCPHLAGLVALILTDNPISEEARQALRDRFGDRVHL